MHVHVSRRRFLGSAGVAAAATVVPSMTSTALAGMREAATPATPTAAEALALLMAGNRRWVRGRLSHPHQSVRRRAALTESQAPFATVFSCIDSRVPPEVMFDRGIGDLAVVRTGAQVLDEGIVMGCVEFAVDHLGTPLILVMGHQRCGAVKAAAGAIESGGTAPGYIGTIIDALRPAYAAAKPQSGDLLDNMARTQTTLTVARLRSDPLLKEFIDRGELDVRGAYYSLDTGAVSLIS